MDFPSTGNGQPPMSEEELRQRVRDLCRLDNRTNAAYLAQTYLYLAIVIGMAVWLCQRQPASGWQFWLILPALAFAILLIGAGQHRLSALGHEGAHHLLLANRYWNDVVSNWCCMFPLFGGTHAYRLQHLAHHQFVNDPARDPDVAQLRSVGICDEFPTLSKAVWRTLLGQLWPLNSLRYILARARYGEAGGFQHPYWRSGATPARRPMRLCTAYLAVQALVLTGSTLHGDWRLLAAIPTLLWVLALVVASRLHEGMYDHCRVRPTISDRTTLLMIVSFYSLLMAGLAWLTLLSGVWAGVYFLLLWVAPLVTAFPCFMFLRQFVQHANCDRGKFTNTRIFLVGPLLEFAIFPLGQKYHLPHHLFASVPHYRLRELHELLLHSAEYRDSAVIAGGYFLRRRGHHSVLEVLGPNHRARESDSPYFDHSVLASSEVEERADILATSGPPAAGIGAASTS